MTSFLIRKFISNADQIQDQAVRTKYGTLSGIVGIIINILLFLSKAIVGLLSSSVSILADSINNLSDAGSSIITLLGFKISAKPADRDHPFGHGRSEYIAGLIIAFLILLLGVELGKSSIEKIIHPEPILATVITLCVLICSILAKVWLWVFNRKLGKKIESNTILATAQDSLNDVVATSAVLISTAVSMLTSWNLDGVVGVLVAIFIIRSGIDVIRSTLGPLLGEAPATEIVTMISKEILSYEGVLGLHDLIVHNYGPGRIFATVHIEVPSSDNILKSHDLIDDIERDFAKKYQIQLVGHLDPVVTDNEQTNSLKELTLKCIREVDPALSIHDFRAVIGESHTNLIFDVMVPMESKMKNKDLYDLIEQRIQQCDPHLFAVVTIDRGYQVQYEQEL